MRLNRLRVRATISSGIPGDDIPRDGEGAFADFLRDAFGAFRIANVHGHRGAAFMQPFRNGPAKAPRGASDDRNPAGVVLQSAHWYWHMPNENKISRR
jgi:hypothetical protein